MHYICSECIVISISLTKATYLHLRIAKGREEKIVNVLETSLLQTDFINIMVRNY